MPAPVALSKPTETERGEWYFQRHVEHLPSAGNMVKDFSVAAPPDPLIVGSGPEFFATR
jgi:Polyphosphate kinase 2 (PPK2)